MQTQKYYVISLQKKEKRKKEKRNSCELLKVK